MSLEMTYLPHYRLDDGRPRISKAYRLNLQNLRIAVLLNAAGSILICLFGSPLLGLFTDNPEILTLARPILLIDIFVEIGRAFNPASRIIPSAARRL